MNIVLIGYRCTGKTCVGQRMAAGLKMPFCDTDELIESSSGKSIREMVDENGWGFFRREEKRVVAGVCERDGAIIALGGGAVLDEENVALLKRRGFFIWLRADAATILKRMQGDARSLDRRPALSGKSFHEETHSLLQLREPLYAGMADLIVETAGRSIEDVAEEISGMIGNGVKKPFPPKGIKCPAAR